MKSYLRLLLLFSIVTYPSLLNAQYFEKPIQRDDSRYINSMFIEVGGNAIIASANYELIIDQSYAIRVGMAPGVFLNSFNEDERRDESYYDREDNMDFVGVVTASRLFGGNDSKLETGIGFVFGESNRKPDNKLPRANGLTFTLGYRYLSLSNRGLVFKAAFTPIINSDGISPWLGASIGFSFTNLFNNDKSPNTRSGY